MKFSPEGFNEVAVRFMHLRWYAVLMTVVCIVGFFILGPLSEKNEQLAWFGVLSIICTLEAFAISIFLFSFKELDSKKTVHPFWYYLTRLKEWFSVIIVTLFIIAPVIMAGDALFTFVKMLT
ncbi:hypothetical protein [Photobacterium sp. J15]|uniref:hypothetical protein n=1 Tax=Photobacterium sp. J15 TaxID=265901 RepID=UPI0007E3AA18|nr:hypothetical protein [Photobacterium sp. J15]